MVQVEELLGTWGRVSLVCVDRENKKKEIMEIQMREEKGCIHALRTVTLPIRGRAQYPYAFHSAGEALLRSPCNEGQSFAVSERRADPVSQTAVSLTYACEDQCGEHAY